MPPPSTQPCYLCCKGKESSLPAKQYCYSLLQRSTEQAMESRVPLSSCHMMLVQPASSSLSAALFGARGRFFLGQAASAFRQMAVECTSNPDRKGTADLCGRLAMAPWHPSESHSGWSCRPAQALKHAHGTQGILEPVHSPATLASQLMSLVT